ncbi:MAG: bifunctional alpha/beta hydrolase/OsmC family protein [Hyphomicrobiales bacterium]
MAGQSLKSKKITFPGHAGEQLAARLDMPAGPVRAYALFAHCFTCSKDIFAASRISTSLSDQGIAVLRFDFTGLGASEGEFANTNFSTNVQDLVEAAKYMRVNLAAPSLLVGHSLGGAAVLIAAGDIPEVKAVATIGAPADAEHVIHNFGASVYDIDKKGEAMVTLAGREFTIQKQFLEDVRSVNLAERIGKLKRALLIFHAPLDQTVGIENAGLIFGVAKHPKSFISLDDADHLLSRRQDAIYVASVLSAWASRFIDMPEQAEERPESDAVLVRETGHGKFQQDVFVRAHHMLADEPASVGGMDTGPTPYDFLSIALGACTSMTLRIYAEHKGLELGQISVAVSHDKVHAKDCAECEGREGRVDRFEREISVAGQVSDELADKLEEIAGKCPVHRTLEKSSAVATKVNLTKI